MIEKNPFVYGQVVKDNNFYDRKTETKQIIQTLKGGNNVVLFAPRRFGKTSLVFKVMEMLEKDGITCIYFDLMQTYSIESFIQLYISAIEKKQKKSEVFFNKVLSLLSNLKPVVTVSKEGLPEFSFSNIEEKIDAETISNVLDLPQNIMEKNKSIVVVMDEFQEITKFENYGLERMLRSKVQTQEVKYLFLGSKTHILNNMFSDSKRPFYNSALQISISYLPTKDTIEFLQTNFGAYGIRIEKEECLYIIERTMNIPYYIQLLSSQIWQECIEKKEKVTKEIIAKLCKNIIALKGDYYFELFDRQSLLQKKLLIAISKDGENILSSLYIKKHGLSSISGTQKACASLIEKGIIDRKNDAYYITDPFFKIYLLSIYK